jgi:DNA-binding Lrp family transcriptional regulator
VDLYNYREKIILRKISEDATTSLEELAEAAKCSRITASKILNKLIDRLKIHFTIELDEEKIGLTQRHIIILKFKKKPEEEYLRRLLENDRVVSNAYLCEGDFDLIINARLNDSMLYIVWESKFPSLLADFEPKIYPSTLMVNNFGYLPINPDQLTMSNLNEKDRLILAELAKNSRTSLTELSKRLGINRTTLNYRIHMLKKEGIIKRFTIAANNPHKNYILTFVANYVFAKDTPARSIRMMHYYQEYDKELPLLNTFQLLAPMSGSYRFLAIGLFDDEKDAAEHAINAHYEIFDKEHVAIKKARITSLLKGSYPFRSLDIVSNYRRAPWGPPYTK